MRRFSREPRWDSQSWSFLFIQLFDVLTAGVDGNFKMQIDFWCKLQLHFHLVPSWKSSSSYFRSNRSTFEYSTPLIQSFDHGNIRVNFMLLPCRTQLNGFAAPAQRVSELTGMWMQAGAWACIRLFHKSKWADAKRLGQWNQHDPVVQLNKSIHPLGSAARWSSPRGH